jgi:hypothetical protein
MGLNDSEISDLLNEIRLENAIATELQLTSQIIKKTGVFKKVDNLYGEPNAEYDFSQLQGGDGGMMGGGAMGGGGMMGGMGDELGDLGEPGAADEGILGGSEGSVPLENAGGGEQLLEMFNTRANVLKAYLKEYKKLINKNNDEDENVGTELLDKAFLINESIDSSLKDIEKNKVDNIL